MRRHLSAAALALIGCNDPPQAGVLTITPDAPFTTDELVASFTEPPTDDNDDELTLEWTWRLEDTVVGDLTTERVPAGRTARGQVWTAEAIAMDKRESSEPMTASVTVANSPPTVTLSGPDPAATTVDDLAVQADANDADGDTLELTYTWTVNGTTTTFDGPTVPADATAKGEVWEVEVTVSDQDGPGETQRAATTILNAAPSLATAQIAPDEIREETVVTCATTGWADPDGDPESANITWLVNGGEVATGPELTGSSFAKGDAVACRAEPDDGESVGVPVQSEPVTVRNTVPSITAASFTPAAVRTADAVEATFEGIVDADGDTVTLAFSWTVNGAVVSTAAILAAESHAKGDVIGLTVVPNDGMEDGPGFVLDDITVLNTAPEVSSASITPGLARTDDVLSVTPVLFDIDGDDVEVAYSWTVDTVATATTATLDGTTAFDKGDAVAVTLTPTDGEDTGIAFPTASITIANTAPTAPGVDIDPPTPLVGVSLECLIDEEAFDADGDPITYTARWEVDGSAYTSATTTDFTNDTIPASVTADEEEWSCYVTASDGADSATEVSDMVTVVRWTGRRTFTNCAASGQNGPSAAACTTAYGGTTLAGEVSVSGGKQSWTVPLDGTYRIEAHGAQGKSAESTRTGGRGARMRGDFSLTKGQVLTIIVGQEGTQNSCNGGGGGASAVNRSTTALLVAGGGGGTRESVAQNGCDASTAQQGGTGSGSSSTHGCGLKSTSTIGSGGIVSASSWGSGGGAWTLNGAGEYTGGTGGQRLSGTAVGGGTTSYPAYGGFGGGGAGNGGCGGGGGGGYSGGDGGRLAGAGGSYNRGSSQSNSAGARSGMGLVTIDLQ